MAGKTALSITLDRDTLDIVDTVSNEYEGNRSQAVRALIREAWEKRLSPHLPSETPTPSPA